MKFEITEEKPIYRQLTEYLETQILDGNLEPDATLPSVRTLAVDLQVNPQTILKSLQELMQRDIIYKKRGLGMFVTPDARERLITEHRDVYLRAELAQCLQRGLALDIRREELLAKVREILEEAKA